MKSKLEVLRKIAEEFNKENITWAVGASVLLFFKGIVNEFHDIDIMFDEKDSYKVKNILDRFGKHIPSPPNDMFKTKYFYEYVIDEVDIDAMGGFIVVKDGKDYDCALKEDFISEHITYNGIDIPLYSLKQWRYFYELINRPNKVELIDEYESKNK